MHFLLVRVSGRVLKAWDGSIQRLQDPLSERRQRRGMGVLRPLSDFDGSGGPQRRHDLRALFNALRYIAKTGVQWRYLPENFPPYHAVFQQAQRWIRAGVLESMASDLRKLLRMLQHRSSAPSAVILDGRTMQSVPESGARAGYDGHKRKKGSKAHGPPPFKADFGLHGAATHR